jgi:hypothetical protein
VFAQDICASTGLKLDRLAKRNAECLNCWFCEFWRIIEPKLPSLEKSQRGSYDSRFSVNSSRAPEHSPWEAFSGIEDPDLWSSFSSVDDPSSNDLGQED